MPNIICEELVYKDGKVDIVEQEASKLWNEKIQRLEEEIKELKEKLDEGTEQHLADTKKLNKFYMKTKEENEELIKEGKEKGKVLIAKTLNAIEQGFEKVSKTLDERKKKGKPKTKKAQGKATEK